jgi:hypothetical protein
MRHDPDRPLPTVRSALANGCQVDALCQDCENISRLDRVRLAPLGYGALPLIELPLICACGS